MDHLKQLCSLDHTHRSDYLLTQVIEQLCNCRNNCLVLRLSFRENLVTQNFPKLTVVTLNFEFKPAILNTFLKSWLNQFASTEISILKGLVRLVFDNEQVIGKSYGIKANKNSVSASAISQ